MSTVSQEGKPSSHAEGFRAGGGEQEPHLSDDLNVQLCLHSQAPGFC